MRVTIEGEPAEAEVTIEQLRAYLERTGWGRADENGFERWLPPRGARQVWLLGERATGTAPGPVDVVLAVRLVAENEGRPPVCVLSDIVGQPLTHDQRWAWNERALRLALER